MLVMAPNEGGTMPRFKCTACDAGFYSAAILVQLNDPACSACGSRLETVDSPSALELLDDRVGRLVAQREVARAQARVDSERWADDSGLVGAAL
jgi:hypothetical protein